MPNTEIKLKQRITGKMNNGNKRELTGSGIGKGGTHKFIGIIIIQWKLS